MDTYETAFKLLKLVMDGPKDKREETIDLYLEILKKINNPDSNQSSNHKV